MKISVLGAGAWGTSLARLLSQSGGNEVTLWGHNAEHLEDLRRSGKNERYLPGIALPRELQFEADLARALREAEAVLVAVPSVAFRSVTRSLAPFSGIVVS